MLNRGAIQLAIVQEIRVIGINQSTPIRPTVLTADVQSPMETLRGR
jgi:hypothetical protein